MSAFNSDEYAWKDLKIFMAGRLLTGFRGLKYKVSRTMTDIYASGDEPHTRTKGNKKRDGEIVLLQSEVQALLLAAIAQFGRDADLTDLTFDITAAYAVSPTSAIVTHQLITCDIPEFEMGMAQDDPNMEVTLPLMIGKIRFAA